MGLSSLSVTTKAWIYRDLTLQVLAALKIRALLSKSVLQARSFWQSVLLEQNSAFQYY